MTLTLLGCSQKTTKSQETSQEKQGTQLVLTAVDKNLESVFKENFNIVVKAHRDLIYRQDTIVRGLPQTFTEDRPDLENATLLYNAKTNEAIFTYFYKPRQNDLYVSPSYPVMLVKLASYHYIAKDVASYFEKVIGIMKTKGVKMEFPKIYTAFLVNENQYLQIDQTEQFNLILDVKLPAQKDPVHLKGGFASGLIQTNVSKPNKLVSGEYSQEISLLEFFNVSPSALITETSSSSIGSTSTNTNTGTTNELISTLDSTKEWVKTRQILVKTQDEAKSIISQLKNGANFEQLAKEKSIAPGAKDDGGEMGYARKEFNIEEYSNAAFSQKVGTFSLEPVKTEFGYHIILVEDHRFPTGNVATNQSVQPNSTPAEQSVGTVQDGTGNYKHFSKFDGEWGYSVDYPENFEQLPPDAHGGGQSFLSPDKKTSISTQVTMNNGNKTPQEVYEFELEADRVLKRARTVISKSIGDQWIEITRSDAEGNIIFLRGIVNQNFIIYFQIKYPSDHLEIYEPIQRHIADSLKKTL